jgi:methylenetetrahydrofolate reductase (NADPH)
MTSLDLHERLRPGAFAVTAELVPPRSADADAVRVQARELIAIADAINVTDNPQARVRMAGLAAAALIVAEGGSPIMQMTTRDRNRLALGADLLGAAALGVRAVLPLFGDPVGEGSPVKEARDLETLGLIGLAAGLAEGTLPDGRALDAPMPRLAIGTAATAGPAPVTGLAAKLDAGATFVQTQVVLDVEAFAEWLERVRAAGLHERAAIIPSVVVPSSSAIVRRIAGFGVSVPDHVAAAAERGDGEAAATAIVEALCALPGVSGIHLIPLGEHADVRTRLAAHARSLRG